MPVLYVRCALLILALALLAVAQSPVAIGPSTTGGNGIGVVHYLDWYNATPTGGCTDGAVGACVGHKPSGDAYYWTAWLPNASGLPITGGLPIVGTINDYNDNFTSSCSGNIELLQLDTFSWASPTASHVTRVNCMTSYGTVPAASDVPTGWKGMLYSADGSAVNGTWKNRVSFSKGGLLYLAVERQISAGNAAIHDATIIVSPDSGAHWCNPYTLFNVGTSPGVCNSSKWQADGDAPVCGAGSAGAACTDTGYLDGTHSSIMFKQLPLGTENWAWINYGYQDCTSLPCGTEPTGINDGCDPTAFTCFMLTPGSKLARVAIADNILDISKWHYYTCPTATQSYRCPGSDSGNWTVTFANATETLATTYPFATFEPVLPDPYSVFYIKEFKSYVMPGRGNGDTPNFLYAPAIQGPWTTFYWAPAANTITSHFLVLAPALGYTVISTNPPHVQIGASSNNYPSGAAAQNLMMYDFVLGQQQQGMANRMNDTVKLISGSGYQFGGGQNSLPQNGLIWSFDYQDQGWASGITNWPFFVDRGTKSAVMVPCEGHYFNGTNNAYSTPTGCAFMRGTSGHGIQLANNAVVITDQNEDVGGHMRTFTSELGFATEFVGATQANAPANFQGNGSYTVIGIYKYNAATIFNRPGGMWSTGSQTTSTNTMIEANLVNGKLQLDWNATGKPRYQYLSNWTYPDTTNYYFTAVTVQAQGGGCTTACVPTAHVWAGVSGLLTDYLSGVSYTTANSPTQQTPAVAAGPFVLGLNAAGDSASMDYATTLVYDHALSFAEVQQAYRALKAKFAVQRGVVVQ